MSFIATKQSSPLAIDAPHLGHQRLPVQGGSLAAVAGRWLDIMWTGGQHHGARTSFGSG
jgi:hypothetical protein